jgi:hypothetical protein
MKRAAVVLGLVVFLLLAGTGIGYASWSAMSGVSGTVTTGTFEVTLDGAEQLEAVHTSASTSSAVASLSLTTTGMGAVALSLSTTSDNAPLAGAIRLRAWLAGSGGCEAQVPQTGVTESTLAAPRLPSGAEAIQAPTTLVVCAVTDVPSGFASHAGTSVTVRMTLTGALVGSSWTAADHGSFGQTVAAAPAPSLVCVDTADHTNVVVKWSNPSDAPATTQYRAVFVTASGGETAIPGSPSYWSTELWVGAAVFPGVGDYTVLVRMHPDSALSGTGTLVGQRTVHVTSNEWNSGLRVQCG